MIKAVTVLAYVIDGIERALASTDTSLKAKNAAGKIIHDANLTADSWTETFLVAHLYVWFLLSGLWAKHQVSAKAMSSAKAVSKAVASLHRKAASPKSVLTQYIEPQQVVIDSETEPGVLYNADFDNRPGSEQTELLRGDDTVPDDSRTT